jgi:hypothetical protein
MESEKGYNERLFEGNRFRAYFHNARFNWFQSQCARYQPRNIRMVELGCFDGRLTQFCPSEPESYHGFDAGWEDGLATAMARYKDHPNKRFSLATEPGHLGVMATASCNVGASMETIEHVPPALVDGYLAELARIIDGYFFVTVPNEKGPMFLAKHMAKVALGASQPYTAKELVAATFGNLSQVERNEHKGFDYAVLTSQISRHFDIVGVEPVPFGWLPTLTGFTIGIIAKSKAR